MLKRANYTVENLAMLGSYQDPDTARLVPAASLQDTMEAALQGYGHNARCPHPDGMVEDPDGGPVRLWDEDAGFKGGARRPYSTEAGRGDDGRLPANSGQNALSAELSRRLVPAGPNG